MVKITDENIIMILKEHLADHRHNKKKFDILGVEHVFDTLIDSIRKVVNNQSMNILTAGIIYEYTHNYLIKMTPKDFKPDIKFNDDGRPFFKMAVGKSFTRKEVDESLLIEHAYLSIFFHKHYEINTFGDGVMLSEKGGK
jgi:hypothetical protein